MCAMLLVTHLEVNVLQYYFLTTEEQSHGTKHSYVLCNWEKLKLKK